MITNVYATSGIKCRDELESILTLVGYKIDVWIYRFEFITFIYQLILFKKQFRRKVLFC